MITTVISYCSLDLRFLEVTIKQSLPFSREVIVVAYDHLLNGVREDLDTARRVVAKFDGVRLVVFPFMPAQPAKFHHNFARWLGLQLSSEKWLFFLDADEVPEGAKLASLLLQMDLEQYDALTFECYWYFRDLRYQATITEECGLLARRSILNKETIFDDSERWSIKRRADIRYRQKVSSRSGPLLHHFSWARRKEEMLAKVAGWAHRSERDWVGLVELEWAREFSGKDFVHGYNFRVLDKQVFEEIRW